MRLPDGFLDELRARTPLAAVIGRRVKLARSGRQSKGCCPFHNEKSPSFYVYEDGFHCFGCGAHGDAVGFVMQSQGLGFMDAVEMLAGEAGLEMPRPSLAAVEEERRRVDLHGVLAAAAQLYQRRLFTQDGALALAYLRDRGLTDATIEKFGLGWTGPVRGQLASGLASQEIDTGLLVEAGLLRESDDGRPPYDLFFNRVMFPIRDRRGRVISFGGRILGDGQPKYVNGPETALFSKRRTLFALDLARENTRNGCDVVVVEGYMDVIALHQAGFGGAVAPLGTALTEEQLDELWRLSPVPILCFDGDAAGARAALKAVELALPKLTAEQSLRLVALPANEDPDTLVRRSGSRAFQQVLGEARPISTALFSMIAEGVGPSPEQRASLRTKLKAAADLIPDRSLSSEMFQAFLLQFKESRPQPARNPSAFGGRSGFRSVKPPPAFHRPTPGAHTASVERARMLLAILLRHPYLLHDVEEAFGLLELSPDHQKLRDSILQWGAAGSTLDTEALITHLTQTGLAAQAAQALSAVPTPLPACASADAMPAEAESGWWHFFGLMNPDRLEDEVANASRAFETMPDEMAQRRLIALCAARDALRRGRTGWDDNGPEDHA